MQCPSCGTTNPAQARFCTHGGEMLVVGYQPNQSGRFGAPIFCVICTFCLKRLWDLSRIIVLRWGSVIVFL